MLTLTLNAAEKRVQFLLCQADTLLCAQDWVANRGGTELLAPALERACRSLNFSPADISRVACVAGPGSFTGLRLVLATASALARANKARQAGLDYLRCLAASVPALPDERLAVLVNARRGWYYQGLYRMDDSGLPHIQGEISLLPLARPDGQEADQAWPPTPEAEYFLGSAFSSHKECFLPTLRGARALPPEWDQPSPAALARLTQEIDWEKATTEDVAPVYLRECDAVDNLNSLAPKLGLDPAKAHAELHRLMNAELSPDA